MIIKIKNLRLKTIVGIYEWEKDVQRDILINAEIQTDHNSSMLSDDIKDAVDYDQLVAKIKKIIAVNNYKLIEKMVGDIASAIMEDIRIKKCILEIDKLGAVEDLESFSVTEIRER